MIEQRSRRRMSRIGSVIATVALAGGLVAVTATPAQAAALTVNSTADNELPGDGACTLREAINNANADGDGTSSDCAGGDLADTITFAPSVTGTITLGSELTVSDAAGLTITGPGAEVLTISGNDSVRIFNVAPGASLTASGLTLADGSANLGSAVVADGGALLNRGTATVTDVAMTGNAGQFSAGAIENQGTLTVTGSSFTQNGAPFGGGAIRNSVGAVLSVTDSTFTGNSANAGGAIEVNQDGTATITGSTFEDNTAFEVGGAIRNSFATTRVSESTFAENDAGIGAGIASQGGTVSVDRSAFIDNAATGRGGGIDSSFVPLEVSSSTFAGNTAPAGGAIFGNGLTTLSLRNSTLAGNSASAGAASVELFESSATVSGSILATATDQVNCVGPVTDGGANIDSGASCGFTAPSGAAWGSNVQPMLGALADNGGPTVTLLPLPLSPALDAIDPGQLRCPGATPATGDLTTDQRGVIRPQGPKCDIGAVEVEVEPVTVVYTVSPFGKPVTNEPGTTRMKAGDTLPLRFSVTDDEGERITDLAGDEVTLAVLLTQCGGSTPVVDLSFAAGSALQLRTDGSYQVDLKTQKSWSGLCGTVTVSTPNDGERTANLQFSGGGRGRG